MNKVIITVVIIIAVAGITWSAYYLGTQKADTNIRAGAANENSSQDINSDKMTVNKIELDKDFTLQLNQIVFLDEYNVELKLTNLIYDKSSGKITAVLEITDDEKSEEVSISNALTGNYYEGENLTIILKDVTTQTASFLIETRLLSEDDYYCITGANCMPPLVSKFCSQSYIKWAQENCPDFEVVY